MENYRKYFTGEEELLFKLEQLHRKKQKLKELLDNKKEINPFVVAEIVLVLAVTLLFVTYHAQVDDDKATATIITDTIDAINSFRNF